MTSPCVLNVAIDRSTKTLLVKLAELERTSMSEIIRRSIDGYLVELRSQLERQRVEQVAARLDAFAGVRVRPYGASL
jgi:hypothetical protein